MIAKELETLFEFESIKTSSCLFFFFSNHKILPAMNIKQTVNLGGSMSEWLSTRGKSNLWPCELFVHSVLVQLVVVHLTSRMYQE